MCKLFDHHDGGSSMVTIYGIIEKHFQYKVGSFAFFDIFCSILGILLHFFKRLRSKITDPIWRHFSRDTPSRLLRVQLI